jgi:hypothetical protein
MLPPTEKELRAGQIAHVLSRAMRDGEASAIDVLRILRHELRRLNTGNKLKIAIRSSEAQAVIDKYTAAGQPIPNNNSNEALHADHVWPILEQHLRRTTSSKAWVDELRRLATVVCVTAAENYRLMVVEKTTSGPEKYALAGVKFTSPEVPWLGQ